MLNSSPCIMNKNETCNFLKKRQLRPITENVYCSPERSTYSQIVERERESDTGKGKRRDGCDEMVEK